MLMDAAGWGSDRVVRFLLKNGADPNVKNDREGGVNALLIAIEEEKLKVVKVLVENGANLNEKFQKIGGATPLMIAAARGKRNVGIVRYLLQKGADVHATADFRGTPVNALTLAQENGASEVAALLRKHGARLPKGRGRDGAREGGN